jgi:homoserine O-succinyltransferase/O-acetyltransferase
MSVTFDKHRSIASPALAPAELRDADEFDSRLSTRGKVLTIGLINNMPDAALQATERQFLRLLQAAAGDNRINLHCFSLPSVRRAQTAKWHVEKQYNDIADLDRLRIDGLIVTGAEPIATTLPEEPFWQDLTGIIDWAAANTRSTIWSCLAAHAAVLHLDGIERQPLGAKCSGVYDCAKVTDDWLTADVTSPLKVAHSRLNELRKSDLLKRGYRLLTHSAQAGVDMFSKQFGSQFIFFQGHPEYDALSLQREYLRDITRFISHERDSYPNLPVGYFDSATERRLESFQKRTSAERKLPLSAELPRLTLRADIDVGAAAGVIFKNWLRYLSDQAHSPLRNTGTRLPSR